MAESIEDFMLMGDVFDAIEASFKVVTSLGEIFYDRILDMAISSLVPQHAWGWELTCKVRLKSVVGSLPHDEALLLACNEGTLNPLRRERVSNSTSLDRYLDILSVKFGRARPIFSAVLLRLTPLTLALSRGHLNVAEYLIDQGAKANLPEGLSGATDAGRPTSFQPSRWFPIHFAVMLSQDNDREEDAVRVLRKLLGRGVSANQPMILWRPVFQDITPLFVLMAGYEVPVHRVSLGALRILLEYGADPAVLMIWSHLCFGSFVARLQRHANQHAVGGTGGGNNQDLIVRCALMLLSIPDDRSWLPNALLFNSSWAQQTEILLLEELRGIANSSRQPMIAGQDDSSESDE